LYRWVQDTKQDTFSRQIVGWAMSAYRDEALAIDALCIALQRRDILLDQPH
jgi:transposase InsO family protein